MSLRAIHIFFILASITLTVGLGFWSLPESVWAGSSSFAAGALLTAYLFWFVAKSKNLKRS